jgi:hypothetical protein
MSEIVMILRQRILVAILCGACGLGLASPGCQRSSSTQTTQTDARPAAEKSFDEIADIVKRALETGIGGVQGGFVSEKASARTQFSVHNEVTSAITPPTGPNDNYCATVTVTSRTTYSLRHMPETEKKSGEPEKKKNGGHDLGPALPDDSDSSGSNGVEVLDQNLVTSASKTKAVPGKSDDEVNRRADEDVHTYKLAYENNHWVLKSELDPKTEQSVINAFKFALDSQP